MRAFADGCSAMTGTEAISNGTPAFKPPEWKNAQTTMVTMAVVLGVVFLGISYLATVSGAVPSEHVSVLSQIGEAVFGLTPDLLRADLLDDGHPRPRGADELRGLPAPRLDPRQGRVHAAPVRLPWRASRLQRRDRRAGADRDRRGRRLPRARGGADPAVRHRRVHGIHPVPGGHGSPLARRARSGLATQRQSSTVSAQRRPASWPSCSPSPSSASVPGSSS